MSIDPLIRAMPGIASEQAPSKTPRGFLKSEVRIHEVTLYLSVDQGISNCLDVVLIGGFYDGRVELGETVEDKRSVGFE